MKKYYSPEVELIQYDYTDVLGNSNDPQNPVVAKDENDMDEGSLVNP